MIDAVNRRQTSAGGYYTSKCVDVISEAHSGAHVLLTTSCTDALEMCAMLLQLEPGDVIVLPSFTFSSTATAFVREGATLRFCDIDPVSLCLDPEAVEELIDDRVKAIVTVNYAGVSGEIEKLLDLSRRYGIPLIEDNAHGFMATRDGKTLGTFGSLSTLSFHETKNIICGEGGALVINDEQYVERAHILLDKGANRRKFLLGEVDKYSWVDRGSSFGLSEILAAFLFAQLEERQKIQALRRSVHLGYENLFLEVSQKLGLTIPHTFSENIPADHMFYILAHDEKSRDGLIKFLKEKEIQATFHYVPLHSSLAGMRFSDRYMPCPNTDSISSRIVRLPFFNELSSQDLERVFDGVHKFFINT